MNKKTLILCAMAGLLMAGCTSKRTQRTVFGKSDKLRVFVTVIPQAGIVKQIGGKYVDVKTLVSTGTCPETFSPTPKEIGYLSEADVFISLGLPFEDSWLKKISGNSSVVNMKKMTDGIVLRELESLKDIDGDIHQKGDKDPHVWVSLKNLVIMANNTSHILSELMPENKKYFDQNLKTFSDKAKKLDDELRAKFSKQSNKNIFVFHPVFGYLADDYGLKQIPIEIEGKEPSAKQLVELMQVFKKYDAKLIFVQPEFSPKTAEAVAKALNAQIIPISVYNEDVFENIEGIVKIWK